MANYFIILVCDKCLKELKISTNDFTLVNNLVSENISRDWRINKGEIMFVSLAQVVFCIVFLVTSLAGGSILYYVMRKELADKDNIITQLTKLHAIDMRQIGFLKEKLSKQGIDYDI